uniref:DUF4201 domain-containing protein n=1 Tax=Heterorhabditis bacteriophora TaxID=37862 RepID=A0A1I7WVI8_HETBA
MKELEEREIDFDDEVREDELLKQEIMVQKALVSIEVKLEQYGLLKDLDEDSRALLTGKANLRVTVSETGNQLLNAKLTDSLMEKQSKGIRTGLLSSINAQFLLIFRIWRRNFLMFLNLAQWRKLVWRVLLYLLINIII